MRNGPKGGGGGVGCVLYSYIDWGVLRRAPRVGQVELGQGDSRAGCQHHIDHQRQGEKEEEA